MTLERHADEISSVTFSPDGMSLATSSLDGTVSLLRAAKDQPEMDRAAPPYP